MPGCLIDTNVWLALSFARHPHHSAARQAWSLASAQDPWLWCRATQQSFLRLASTPALTQALDVRRCTNLDALQALEAWMALPQVVVVQEPPELMACWARLGSMDKAAPKLWMDAYLAALAIAGGWPLLTLDRDFQQFQAQGLRLRPWPHRL